MSRIGIAFAASGLALALAGGAQAGTFSYVANTEQTFIAPTAGIYEIIAFGAQGGTEGQSAGTGFGGLGAEIGGALALTKGETLTILVGGIGISRTDEAWGGGGGGSFVAKGSTPLVVAGAGGGGVAGDSPSQGGPGQTGPDGFGVNPDGGTGGSGGGGYSTGDGAGGGGGFFGDGGGDAGGKSFLHGGAGGPGLGAIGQETAGGFGGGGGAGATGGRGLQQAAGGGGGYSGGAPGVFGGGGGGSYIDPGATNTVALGGVQRGDGEVDITLVQAFVPEPATWAMMLLGFGALGAAMRQRRLHALL